LNSVGNSAGGIWQREIPSIPAKDQRGFKDMLVILISLFYIPENILNIFY
jgi:hypothetical protein